MCAAKLERTGFVFRNAWPNFKHFAGEQSANFAQASNESGFVRKNSRKAEAAAGPTRTPSAFVQRRCHAVRARLVPRQLSPGILSSSSQSSRRFVAAAIEHAAEAGPKGLQLGIGEERAVPRKENSSRSGVSIDELVKSASEKYDLNEAFWGRYTDIPSMALATEKEEILQIIENFALIHRKHLYLFQRLKATVLRTVEMWSASDLAALCHAWAQLGFLHEDLCVAMASRVTATAYACSTQELCWLMDAYATARCSVQSVVDEIAKQTLLRLEEFTPSQLCLHASSFARLNIRNAQLLSAIARRLEQVPLRIEDSELGLTPSLSARDVTLAAYSFAKLGQHTPQTFEVISRSALPVIRDFTARDLQMLTVALVRVQYRDSELLDALSSQAQRRIAQFSSESLALMLRGMAFFRRSDDVLFTRALAQLPRAIVTFRPSDVTALLGAFAGAQVHSAALFDVVTPYIMEKAPMFTPSDWILALRSYSSLGHRDSTFLSMLAVHLEASKLSLPQLSAALADCSRLSFNGASAALAEAAHAKVAVGDAAGWPADAAAQMYSALLLLGCSQGAGSCASLLRALAEQLRDASLERKLSPASCVDLCYASLLTPPIDGHRSASGHPVDTLQLLRRCTHEAKMLSPEGRALLGLISQALEQLPWSSTALRYAELFQALSHVPLAAKSQLPSACVAGAVGHLVPHHRPLQALQSSGTQSAAAAAQKELGDCLEASAMDGRLDGEVASGVFLAAEIRDSLSNVSAALEAVGVEHSLELEGPLEAHIVLSRSSVLAAKQHTAAAWGNGRVVLLWGSSVHFIGDKEADDRAPLSPAAKFQVAALQAEYGAEVLVLPHWRLACASSAQASAWSSRERGELVLRLLAEQLRQALPLHVREYFLSDQKLDAANGFSP
eukprot:TRINITY_DN28502_c0_g1_i1.p1 TRINITY_DN28502_c0_g1~~TRINITY_DN28502_c0_g1_i1.p1  ORF type:complete len:923 (+),score=192.94 TRINITY_DN28502_c0_g1_i1:68-2770(+)